MISSRTSGKNPVEILEEKNIPNGYLSGVSVSVVLMYTQSTCSTWVKSVLLFVTLVFLPHNLRHRLPKGLLTRPFCAVMLMAQTRSKIFFFETESKPLHRKKVLNINIYGLRFKE